MMRCFIWLSLLWLAEQSLGQNYEWQFHLEGHESPVSFVNFRVEDNLLASGSKTGELVSWDLQKKKVARKFTGHTGLITDIIFSSDNQKMISASHDGTIRLWDLRKGKLLRKWNVPKIEGYADVQGNEPTFVLFSADETAIYFGGYNGKICQVNLNSDEVQTVFSNENFAITTGILSKNEEYLIFGYGSLLGFLNLKSSKLDKTLQKSNQLDDYICEITLVPNQSKLAAWTYGGEVHFWDLRKNEFVQRLRGSSQKGSSQIAFSFDGKSFLTGNDNTKVHVKNLTGEFPPQQLNNHQKAVKTFAFSADNRLIATGSDDRRVSIYKKSYPPKKASTTKKLNGRINEVQHEITVHHKNIDLNFWDNLLEDGDIISVNLNGKWILEKYTLRKATKTLSIELDEKDNYLVIFAHNEGERITNTAALKIKDGDKEHEFILKSYLKTNAAMKINYEPKVN